MTPDRTVVVAGHGFVARSNLPKISPGGPVAASLNGETFMKKMIAEFE